ncbi:MAG: DUF3108 domain-containing protein [Alphaproteobacteria bacterium]|nr:DUF3108 domain-containing protein [Alphaproteobacteria bacterium]
MPRLRALFLVPVGLALLAAAMDLTGPARAETPRIRASYDVYFGGLHILAAEAEFEPGEARYSATARSRTEGILAVFFDWRGQSRSEGRYVDHRAIPSRHRNTGLRGDETRDVEIAYDADGAVTRATVAPPPDPDEVTDLPADAEVGTIDPLSVIAELMRAVTLGRECSGRYAVFDGRRRYDLIVTDQGAATLPPTDYAIYSGPVMVCGVEYRLLGGERKEKSRYAKTARERVVYVARPDATLPAIPVGLKIETDFGTLMAHLTGIETLRRYADGR